MPSIKSPLGALGALMVMLEAIAAGALIPTQSQPMLQTILVICIVFEALAVSLVVLGVIVYFAVKRPAYLFSPSDISPSAHGRLYGSAPSPDSNELQSAPYLDDVEFTVEERE